MKKFFYRVQRGDCIFSISNKFNQCPYKIISDNHLNREIMAGDLLYIEQCDEMLYQVKPLETLSTLSQKFNRTEEQIKNANGNLPYVFYSLKINIP